MRRQDLLHHYYGLNLYVASGITGIPYIKTGQARHAVFAGIDNCLAGRSLL